MSRPDDKLPPWKPKPGKETRWFIDWTIQRWNSLHDAPDRQSELRESDPTILRAVNRELWPEGPLLGALALKDEKKFVRMMRDPEQARYAFRIFTALTEPKRKRDKGRPAKDTVYTGFDPSEHYLDWPVQIVLQIEYVWKRHYGKRQRRKDNPPTAYLIASLILKKEGLAIDADAVEGHRRKLGSARFG